MVGDGSYMMANSELATAVMRRVPFTVVLTDNRGYGCINRLQAGTGGAAFNNMYVDCAVEAQPQIDYVAHAAHGDQEWLAKSAIMGALTLYLDFVNLFLFLLRFLGNRN